MIYLEPEEVVARGQHFNLPCESQQPPIPRGQHLVALLQSGDLSIAVDVTEPRHYRIVCGFVMSVKWSARLYWVGEHELPNCRRTTIQEKHPA